MSRKPPRARRPDIQPTVGLIVEGDAEFAAFPYLHKSKLIASCPPLKAINLGGVSADRKPEGIARLIAPKVIQHQTAGCAKVVICIDREHRALCAPGFASAVIQALRAELQQRGKPSEEVHVVIADRAFEAWLLADAKGLHQRKAFKRAPHFKSFEGQLGEQQKKGAGLAQPRQVPPDARRLSRKPGAPGPPPPLSPPGERRPAAAARPSRPPPAAWPPSPPARPAPAR